MAWGFKQTLRVAAVYYVGLGMCLPLKALAASVNLDGLVGYDELLQGSEVHMEPAQAQRILSEADAGIPESQYLAGLVTLYGGHGVEVNHKKSLEYFRAAADQGHLGAQTNAALMLLRGVGAPVNNIQAAHWFRIAAEKNNADAQWMLGRMYYDGIFGKKRDGHPNMRSALEWFQRSAENGNAQGQLNYAIMHEYGLGGVTVDYARAAELYKLASDQGEALATYYGGILHLYGRGCPQDFKVAAGMIQAAARKGVPQAMNTLGKLHTHGQGVERNYRLALVWFRRAEQSTPDQDPVHQEASTFRLEVQAFLKEVDAQMKETRSTYL
mmetsp:Transcript_10062/g.17683  ORF Transcript_10062/g.17683 Transcript_10062/m.17683 type:complete len:326 (-) Transcript_10062:492-1469(-)|eukprot:CAMPEP_0184512978 /NCGR_PEP_ID=MMETSP0198_2-20121128/3176_1 /TAXON_ID=1112570 /ORGANISM="Thraustochytrium sp., Strain LLF1b" /LENGTH=325 /DNA_ID=CAMNT_0026903053 /DNA_START=129 /DNA_END=1106 /DNA_ORIENTATION=+